MKYLPIILIAALFLAACGAPDSDTKELADKLKEDAAHADKEQPETQEEVQAEPEQTPVEEVEVVEEKVEEKPAEQPKEKTAAEVIAEEETVSPPKPRSKIYDFLDVFRKKVESYSFTYKRDSYSVRGKKFKIILSNAPTAKGVTFGEVEKNLFYYDTIYVDRAAKTAMAYCEGHTSLVNRQCADLELYDLALPVSFSDYNLLLPEDWLYNYLDKTPSEMDPNKYYIDGRVTSFVKFEGNPQVELNFDPGTGLVLRADQKEGTALIARNDYEKLATNRVRDVDVIHRSKSEIPSEEAFYR